MGHILDFDLFDIEFFADDFLEIFTEWFSDGDGCEWLSDADFLLSAQGESEGDNLTDTIHIGIERRKYTRARKFRESL